MTPEVQGQQPTGVEPCAECGVPLAADQRYCLNCGRRRGEPRLDFTEHMRDARPAPTEAPTTAAAPAAAAPDGKRDRDFAPFAAAGGIAVLGLMLLVGVLIGRGDTDASAPAPAQVVRVQDEGASAAEEAEAGAALKGTKAKDGGNGKNSAGGEETDTGNAVTASDSELEALQAQSPEDYSKAAAELPNEIATPGEAPPKDNKEPGGGSKGTTIE